LIGKSHRLKIANTWSIAFRTKNNNKRHRIKSDIQIVDCLLITYKSLDIIYGPKKTLFTTSCAWMVTAIASAASMKSPIKSYWFSSLLVSKKLGSRCGACALNAVALQQEQHRHCWHLWRHIETKSASARVSK
jgi:hypothetical protein